MKFGGTLGGSLLLALLAGTACAPATSPRVSAPTATPPTDQAETTSANVEGPSEDKSGFGAWRPKDDPKEAPHTQTLDPLALDGAVGALPKIVFTPAKELRHNSRASLEQALELIKDQETSEGAAARLAKALGKPTWIQDGKIRVWVVSDKTQCTRLVLRSDGTADLDGARASESTMVAPFAHQNLCTGQISTDEKK
jgi:hypothetical protein